MLRSIGFAGALFTATVTFAQPPAGAPFRPLTRAGVRRQRTITRTASVAPRR